MNDIYTSHQYDFSTFQETTVELTQPELDWALKISQMEENCHRQWQSFIEAMSVKGFQKWLENGSLRLPDSYDFSHYPPLMSTLYCQVGEFRVCIVAQCGLNEGVVHIPGGVVDASYSFPHLFVLVEVEEEINQVIVGSALTYDNLILHKQAYQWELQSDNTYAIPIQCFDVSSEQLLLYLTCLEPEAFTSRNSLIPQTLNTKDMTTFSAKVTPMLREQSPASMKYWLKKTFEQVSDLFHWEMLPPITELKAAMAIRSPRKELQSLLFLIPRELEIPNNAVDFYVDCQSCEFPFRFYAITWPLPEQASSDWALLLFLASNNGSPLPTNTRLKISDQNDNILISETSIPSVESSYLYGQVVGTWDEVFFASVELSNVIIVECPPLSSPFHL